ncbi:hypothetical protein X802_03360 [Thermococcus guaymasensis DSM 11113]|uniref:Uncharacterized protein n=1 Tax=Thermococcus guaymasensis DSM 11113 TaxID=1432656 RepID=A0A0X1KN52_9EURY|nr:hypothetical protein X802_03360 [Thermococcus guaymasensis DSM 11113]
MCPFVKQLLVPLLGNPLLFFPPIGRCGYQDYRATQYCVVAYGRNEFEKPLEAVFNGQVFKTLYEGDNEKLKIGVGRLNVKRW